MRCLAAGFNVCYLEEMEAAVVRTGVEVKDENPNPRGSLAEHSPKPAFGLFYLTYKFTGCQGCDDVDVHCRYTYISLS